MNSTEHELIQQAATGNRQAFGALMQWHRTRVLQFIRRLHGCADEAEDLTQDTFIKAYQALPRWRPEARFHISLLQIARNATLDALRQRRRLPQDPLDEHAQLVDSGPAPLQQLESEHRLALLEQLLAQLPLEQREILLLREVEGLAYTELTTALTINLGTVKSRLTRAREAMLIGYHQANARHSHD